MMKKICLAILAIFITVITASSSYAYFSDKIFIKSANGDSLDVLSIQNGDQKVTIDTSNSKWEYKGESVGENGILNPNTDDIATYSGVKISNDSNLTSNVELKFSFNSLKKGGTDEGADAKPPEINDEEDTRDPATSFEVWVGDVDKFNNPNGYGKGNAKDDKDYVLEGGGSGAEENTGLDIYPETDSDRADRNAPEKFDGTDSNGNLTNDAPGTDRRMVASGFYNFYKKSLGIAKEEVKGKIIVHHQLSELQYIYYWNVVNSQGNSEPNRKPIWGESPETKLNPTTGWYSYTLEDCISTNLIFNDNGGKQTGDLSLTEGEWWYYNDTWYKSDPSNLPSFTWKSFKENGNGLRYETGLHGNSFFYSLMYSKYLLDGSGYKSEENAYESGLIGPLTTDGGEVFFDGYTDRALRRKKENGNDNYTGTHIQNGVNWAELQPVEPITFMYQTKIGTSDNGTQNKVKSATIQLMLNDIQPKASDEKWKEMWPAKNETYNWCKSFSAKANTQYQVTLKVAGSSEPAERVVEWEKIINNLDQHNTVSNLVTLQVPERLLHLVEQGEQNGLELLIDDPRDGSTINPLTRKPDIASGDSYCIDFARLVVNHDETISNAKIIGFVKEADTQKAIEGVNINNGSGESIITDSNGYFEMSVAAGQVVLNFSHPSYVDRSYTIYNIQKGDDIEITIYMTRKPMSPQIKFQGKLTMRKYTKDNTLVKIDGQDSKQYDFNLGQAGMEDKKSEVFTELKIEPGHYYILDYELTLFKREDIDKFTTQNFSLTFSSDIEAKITQENNPGWSESGEQEETTQ